MKKINLTILFVAVAFTIFISGCLHDEDKSVNVGILNGTWFGVEEDVVNGGSSGRNNISFVILSGKIIQVLREDQGAMAMVDLGLIGLISARSSSVFNYTLSDGTDTLGGLYVDPTASHFTFLDDNFRFGMMQKGAAEDPALVYLINDIAGNWSGFSVNVSNASLNVLNNNNSNAAVVADDLTFKGTDGVTSVTGGTFDGSLAPSSSDAMKGIYTGNWINPLDNTKFGNITAILSADKTFLSARFCLSFILPPGNGVPNSEMCTFASWNK